MTLDLKEHMEKKKQESMIKAYDAIGEAVNGMPLGNVLHILASFTASALNTMSAADRAQAAKVFYVVISTEPRQPEETLQ